MNSVMGRKWDWMAKWVSRVSSAWLFGCNSFI